MAGEHNMRRRVVRALKELDAISVENKAGIGTPDVNYIGGWIELKQCKAWPKREDTPLRLPHFTVQQRVWIRKRHHRGGRVHVLLRVGQDWLLFDGDVAARKLGDLSKADLLEKAERAWLGGLNERELLEHLDRRAIAAATPSIRNDAGQGC